MTPKTSLDKSKIKFLLLEGIHPSALQVLNNAGYTNIETVSGRCRPRSCCARLPMCTLSASARAPS
ncbi:hypothetical protein [Comamonas aquatica]|uniref:hypothetical protein n=1 Tax=Comamonas aquatica TaxID=225991 RepID=UPI001E7AA43B|nr:hypothetical protein [Comamonas aquatica]CAC9678019.1 D-3-phosphoglycerate dehydrogenase [Comamonas aquatica]